MHKKLSTLLLVLLCAMILTLGLFLSACGGPKEEPAPAPVDEQTTDVQDSEEGDADETGDADEDADVTATDSGDADEEEGAADQEGDAAEATDDAAAADAEEVELPD